MRPGWRDRAMRCSVGLVAPVGGIWVCWTARCRYHLSSRLACPSAGGRTSIPSDRGTTPTLGKPLCTGGCSSIWLAQICAGQSCASLALAHVWLGLSTDRGGCPHGLAGRNLRARSSACWRRWLHERQLSSAVGEGPCRWRSTWGGQTAFGFQLEDLVATASAASWLWSLDQPFV